MGSKLDDFLRALLVAVAAAAGRDPAALLPQVGRKTVSLRRATAGQLLRSIREAADGVTLDPAVRTCVKDARSPTSVLGAVVGLRNLAVHETALPKDANATLRRLGALLRKSRREAGWDQ